MQHSVPDSRHSNLIRRGFIHAAKIGACVFLSVFAFQLALGAAGLYAAAPSHRVTEQWPNLLMVTIGLSLLYRAAGSLAFHVLGRSPIWAWPCVRSRVVEALRRPAAG